MAARGIFAVAGIALVASIAGARAEHEAAHSNDPALDAWSEATGADAASMRSISGPRWSAAR